MFPTHHSRPAPLSSRLHAPLPRFFLGLVSAVTFFFGLQAIAYYGFDRGTGKGESNYFSTVSRFQAAAQSPADIALAGSSITGRIPGREVGNADIANLGSDGGPALDGIRLLVQGRIARPRWLVVEMNTLFGGVGFGDTLIVQGAQGPWFSVGSQYPLLGASARPSAMFYASLLNRSKIRSGESFPVTAQLISSIPVTLGNEFSPLEKQRFEAYLEAIKELQQQGVKILLVHYPAGPMNEHENHLMTASLAELSAHIPLEYLDLNAQIPRESLQFTDGVHMAPQSAARVLSTIKEICFAKDQELER